MRTALVFILAAGAGLAQGPALWRFMEMPDGLPETYQFQSTPAPGPFARIFAGPGDPWSVTPGGLFRFEGGQWVRHPVPQFYRSLEANTPPRA